jgi:hypothetical protein
MKLLKVTKPEKLKVVKKWLVLTILSKYPLTIVLVVNSVLNLAQMMLLS